MLKYRLRKEFLFEVRNEADADDQQESEHRRDEHDVVATQVTPEAIATQQVRHTQAEVVGRHLQ